MTTLKVIGCSQFTPCQLQPSWITPSFSVASTAQCGHILHSAHGLDSSYVATCRCLGNCSTVYLSFPCSDTRDRNLTWRLSNYPVFSQPVSPVGRRWPHTSSISSGLADVNRSYLGHLENNRETWITVIRTPEHHNVIYQNLTAYLHVTDSSDPQ